MGGTSLSAGDKAAAAAVARRRLHDPHNRTDATRTGPQPVTNGQEIARMPPPHGVPDGVPDGRPPCGTAMHHATAPQPPPCAAVCAILETRMCTLMCVHGYFAIHAYWSRPRYNGQATTRPETPCFRHGEQAKRTQAPSAVDRASSSLVRHHKSPRSLSS